MSEEQKIEDWTEGLSPEDTAAVNAAISGDSNGAPGFWVVVVDDLLPPPPELHRFASLKEAADFIRLTNKDRKTAWVLPIHGQILRVTKTTGPGIKFLVGVDGTQEPLFETTDKVEFEDIGFCSPAGSLWTDVLSAAGNPKPEKRGGRAAARQIQEFDDEEDPDEDSSDLEF